MTHPKRSILLLRTAAVLALVTGVCQAFLYGYANRHFQEILKKGSVPLFGGTFSVTADMALVNPYLTAAVVCLALAAACFFTARRWSREKRSGTF